MKVLGDNVKHIIILLALVSTGCDQLFFYPESSHVLSPAMLSLVYEDVWITGNDGSGEEPKLHGWLLPGLGESRGTILHLHGNAKNISTHIASVYWLPPHGFTVLQIDYRGYGKSEGSPSQLGLVRDVTRAIKYLKQDSARFPKPWFLYGQSLGGAVALYVAAQSGHASNFSAVIAESPFAGYREIAQDKIATNVLLKPLAWLLVRGITDEYSPIEYIAQIAPTPVLLVHGTLDEIVPINHALLLYARAEDPKDLWLVPGKGHIATFQDTIWQHRLLAYLMGCSHMGRN